MHWETGEKLWKGSWESFQVIVISVTGVWRSIAGSVWSVALKLIIGQCVDWSLVVMQPPGSGTRGPDQEYTLLLRRTHSRQTIISFPHTLHVLVNNRKLRMGWPSIKRLPSCRAGKVGGRSDSVVARCCSPNDVSPLPSVISEKHYLPSINYLFYPWHFIIFGGAWGDQEQGVDERGKSCWRQLCEKSKLTFAFWLSLSDRRFGGSNTQWARVSMIQRWNNLHSYLKITLSKSWCHEKKGKLRIRNGKELNGKWQNNNKIYEDKVVPKQKVKYKRNLDRECVNWW